MINIDQLPEQQRTIINVQVQKFKKPVVTEEIPKIPDANDIYGESSGKWLKIKDVICVFVDMKNSTKLNAAHYANTTARSYTLFTGTAVRLFRSFDARYIDIKGDGVFALFDSDQVNTAFVAAVTFKTFIEQEFTQHVSSKTHVDTGVRIGIDQSTLLVSKIGLRKDSSRADIHNEVWAGKAVNVAAKLSSLSNDDEIHVSAKYFEKLKSSKILYSCGCSSLKKLWDSVDVSSDDRFSFDTAYVLKSAWCTKHGAEYIADILAEDKC